MKATGTGGSILNVSSVASRVVLDGGVVYCSLKAALDHLTHVMAVTLAPYKVQSTHVAEFATGGRKAYTSISDKLRLNGH